MLLISCGGGGAKEGLADDYLCDLPSKSVEEEIVLKALGGEKARTTIFAQPSDLVARMEGRLGELASSEDATGTDVCLFQTPLMSGSKASVRISFQWAAPEKGKAAGRPLRDANRYVVNGLPAEANEGDVKLSFSCVMPGEKRAASRQAQLVGWVSLTGGPRKGPQREWDVQHVTLSYLMAQRTVEALGCEKKPLQGEPVVKPVGE
ncbi:MULTISPECIES: hypothetical protein [Streptomyces]|uniref:Uncharacterized protein n=2 Tax=Streptomyces TaxID=1883 RepID=A0A100Y1W3_9ACTN|nr:MULTISPECIES: hypothetical protein [Streptomyces]KUH36152.1 hypothetical protein ATE80_25255 [Streptomyces kanasensis]UUS31305.1 hypothetical protein NRO40_10965 [Streptomyces changanensis]